jgi:hypothetical protein
VIRSDLDSGRRIVSFFRLERNLSRQYTSRLFSQILHGRFLVNFLSIRNVFCTFANPSEKNNNKRRADRCMASFNMHVKSRPRLECRVPESNG